MFVTGGESLVAYIYRFGARNLLRLSAPANSAVLTGRPGALGRGQMTSRKGRQPPQGCRGPQAVALREGGEES